MPAPGQIRIVQIFISAGHNFFGNPGENAGKYPIIEVPKVECVAGQGLYGDRFFGYKEDYKGQVTFFSQEVFEDVCHSLGVTGKNAGVTRRNIITRGVDLNSLIGKEFEIQGIRFLGTMESTPCHWMDFAIAPGAEAALRGRGGLRAKILTDGELHAGK